MDYDSQELQFHLPDVQENLASCLQLRLAEEGVRTAVLLCSWPYQLTASQQKYPPSSTRQRWAGGGKPIVIDDCNPRLLGTQQSVEKTMGIRQIDHGGAHIVGCSIVLATTCVSLRTYSKP
jgi:hypothetical protein